MGVVRYVILALSAGAMVVGVLMTAGVLVPQRTPEGFRQILGVVVFLYGLYRFVVEYARQGRRDESGRRRRHPVDRGGGSGMYP